MIKNSFVPSILATCFSVVFLSSAYGIRAWSARYPDSVIADLSFVALLCVAAVAAVLLTLFFRSLVLPGLPTRPILRWGGLAAFWILFFGLFFCLSKPKVGEYRSFFHATADGSDEDGDPMLNSPALSKRGAYTLHPETKGVRRFSTLHLKNTSAEHPCWKISFEPVRKKDSKQQAPPGDARYELVFSGNGLPAKRLELDRKATDPAHLVEERTGYSQVDIRAGGDPAAGNVYDHLRIVPKSFARFSGVQMWVRNLGRFMCFACFPFLPFFLFFVYKTCRSRPDLLPRWESVLVRPFYRDGKSTLLLFWLPVLLYASFSLYMMYRGETGYCRIHDYLDGGVPMVKTFAEQANSVFDIFGDRPIEAYMSGQVKYSLTRILALLFYCFGWLNGLAINAFIVKTVAYVGMYLLLSRHVIPNGDNECLPIGIAFCYSLLNFYSIMGISIAGIPLLVYVFLNLFSGKAKIWDWLLLIVMPLHMVAAVTLIFFTVLLSACWLAAAIYRRRVFWPVLLGLFVLTAAWCVNDRDTILRHFGKSEGEAVSQRTSWTKRHLLPAQWKLDTFKKTFDTCGLPWGSSAKGHGYAGTIPWNLVLYSLLFAAVIAMKNVAINKKILLGILVVLLLVFFQSLPYESLFYRATGIVLPRVQIRFFWLLPTFHIIVFALCLDEIRRFFTPRIASVVLLCFLGSFFYSTFDFYLEGYGKGYVTEFAKRFVFRKPALLYNANRFDTTCWPGLHDEIRKYIDRPQSEYRVGGVSSTWTGHIGPLVSGFHTIDGYASDYSMKYKMLFRQVIEKELEKSVNLPPHTGKGNWKNYFDTWGSRAYLCVPGNPQDGRYVNLEYNTDVLYEMNCLYLIADCPIVDSPAMNIVFEKKFTQPDPYHSLYLYKVLPGPVKKAVEPPETSVPEPTTPAPVQDAKT